MVCENKDSAVQWFAMRDLSRRHAKNPAYKLLTGLQFEIFTPMTRKIVVKQGKRVSCEIPVMQDLLFVHDTRERVDAAVKKIDNLQYRFIRGGYCEPMVVRDEAMERFIHAVKSSHLPRYFQPEEITREMCGQYIRIIGGHLNGYEGYLLSLRGSKYKRLMVELPNFMTVAVEVQPDLIEVLQQ